MGERDGVAVKLGVGVRVAVELGESVGVLVGTRDDDAVALGVPVRAAVPVGVPVGVKLGRTVNVGVGERDGLAVGEALALTVGVCVPLGEAVGGRLGVGEDVGVSVTPGTQWHPVPSASGTHCSLGLGQVPPHSTVPGMKLHGCGLGVREGNGDALKVGVALGARVTVNVGVGEDVALLPGVGVLHFPPKPAKDAISAAESARSKISISSRLNSK